jgi:hypothetical protein
VVNRAATAFRTAATTLVRSQSYLGAQYRRLRTRLEAPKAITAMVRKFARLFYRLIKHGQQYVDKGMEYYEARYREQQIRSLLKRAQKLGFQCIMKERPPEIEAGCGVPPLRCALEWLAAAAAMGQG